MSNVLTLILAGGEGARLKPLTAVRTKPAVPFGGNYRIIDFVLSNFVNSGLLKSTNKSSSKLPLMQDIDDWSLARKISTVYRILQYQDIGNDLNSIGKGSIQIVLDSLSANECYKIFDGLLQQSAQIESITGLIAHCDQPRVNSWLKTLWPSATEQMKGLIQKWQNEIIGNNLWVGTTAILRKKLEKIYP